MPYIKKADPPWTPMTRLLRGRGLNPPALAEIIGKSRPTAQARLENPGTFTLDELHKISTRAHIPMDEIREAVKR